MNRVATNSLKLLEQLRLRLRTSHYSYRRVAGVRAHWGLGNSFPEFRARGLVRPSLGFGYDVSGRRIPHSPAIPGREFHVA